MKANLPQLQNKGDYHMNILKRLNSSIRYILIVSLIASANVGSQEMSEETMAGSSSEKNQKKYELRIVFEAKGDYHFDRDYYVKKHLEFAKKLLVGRVNLTRLEAQWDVKTLDRADVANLKGTADTLAPLILSLYLDSDKDLKDFQAFLVSPEARDVLDADVKNFTNLSPQWTIAEVEEFVWESDD